VFTTCTFCHASLGTNDAIEHFPVGRRLAFDGERGRLWAVCPRCARWNLAPIEERWEAIEACERAYRGATRRVSTDNIALARLKEGTDLVRIGRPLLPELAAWRYGSRLASRRRRHMVAVAGGTVVVAAGLAGVTYGIAAAAYGATAFLSSALVAPAWRLLVETPYRYYRDRHAVLRLDWPGLGVTRCTRDELASLRLSHAEDGTPALTMWRRMPSRNFWREPDEHVTLAAVGDAQRDLLRVVMPYVNRAGSDALTIREATRVLDAEPNAEVILARLRTERSIFGPSQDGRLSDLPVASRLAFEMALHEDDERRALAGELGALYARWEEAERIARIADGELTKLAEQA
jgi:hypothetical protein